MRCFVWLDTGLLRRVLLCCCLCSIGWLSIATANKPAQPKINQLAPAAHQTLYLNSDVMMYAVTPVLQRFPDSSVDWTKLLNESAWQAFPKDKPLLGNEVIWLRLRVQSLSPTSQWHLKLNDNTAELVQLYSRPNATQSASFLSTQSTPANINSSTRLQLLSDPSSLGSQAFPDSRFNQHTTHLDMSVPLKLVANQPYDLYLQISGYRQPFLQLEIWDQEALAGYQDRQMFTFGAFIGGCLLIVSMLIAASLVTRHTAIYVQLIYILLLLCMHLSQQGFLQKLLWPDYQQSMNHFSLWISAAWMTNGLLLLREMLGNRMPARLSQAYYLLAISLIVFTLVFGSFNEVFLHQIMQFGVMIYLLLSIVTLLLLGAWRHMSFRFMTLGFVVAGLGLVNSTGLVWPANSFERSNALTISLMSHLIFVVCGCFIAVRQTLGQRLQEKLAEIEAAHQHNLLQQKMTHQALCDPLTGCPNRIALQKRLQQKIDENASGQYSLILIHLGRFKEINNTLGHQNGDELLKRVSLRLNAIVSQLNGCINLDIAAAKVTHLAALEGVVFGVLLENVKPAPLMAIGETLSQALIQPFEYQHLTLDISGFIGMASYPEHGQQSSDILQHAYVAIEVAKDREQTIVYYSTALDPYSARRLTLVAELKQALRHKGLQLYYQPQIDLAEGRVVGVEALLRWRHPQHGFIPPDEFIPVAEKTGVIRQLTAWVMDAAIQQAQVFYQQGIALRMSINLSAKNLQEAELLNEIIALLQKYILPAELICLEITETAMMKDPQRSMQNILALHECGLRLSIDDFGTGHSSLAYLKRLPVDEIKIDRSFVSEMCIDKDDQVIVNTTLQMSHNFGKEVVAEGIEDAQTYQLLQSLGCNVGQGYYISRPLPIEQLQQWLQDCPYQTQTVHPPSLRRDYLGMWVPPKLS